MLAEEVEIGFQAHQWDAITATEPDVCLLTGLGGGKTYTGGRWIVSRALEFPESIHLATVNSYTQAQDMVIPGLTDACEEMGVEYRWVAMQQRPTLFINVGDREAEIRVRSTKEYDRLRGPEYGSWWADEIRDAPLAAVQVVIGRLRCKRVDVPRMLWTTTPNGMDHIYERFVENAVAVKRYRIPRMFQGETIEIEVTHWKHKDGERLLIQTDTRANAMVREGYAEKLGKNYDPKLLEQERGGGFVVLGQLCYYGFDRRRNVAPLTYNPNAPLAVCLDFNVEPCVAVIVQEFGGRSHVIDEIALDPSPLIAPTPAVIAEFQRRYPQHRDGRGVTIYGDPSGWNRSTRTLLSDYNYWQKAMPNVGVNVPPAHPFIVDRLNAVNARFFSDDAVRMMVDPKCAKLIKDFERVKSKKEKREPDKDDNDKSLTHLSDALGYYVVLNFPAQVPTTNVHRESDRRHFV